jgi:hypothetical protein
VDSRRETVSLIGSDKVESTPVYGAVGRKIGAVQRVMIDKIAARLLGRPFRALPWPNCHSGRNKATDRRFMLRDCRAAG